MKALLPEGWPRPRGYANGISARGRMLFTAGIIGWDKDGRFAADDLPGQLRQALSNILAILAADDAGPEHLVRLTWYVTDIHAYRANLKAIGAAYREIIGNHFPAMAVVEVRSLVEPQAMIEIEATAVVPDP